MEPSPKAWASGRVLSEAQRARKRENDKKSVREKRQSTQRRIAQLEEMIFLLEGPTAANLHLLCLGDQTERLKHSKEIQSKIQEKAPDVATPDESKMIYDFLLTNLIYLTVVWLIGNREAVEPLSQRDKYQLLSSPAPHYGENLPGLSLLPVGSGPISLYSDAECENPRDRKSVV